MWVGGIPPFRQKKGERMGHGDVRRTGKHNACGPPADLYRIPIDKFFGCGFERGGKPEIDEAGPWIFSSN
jgi:hypothetical protein